MPSKAAGQDLLPHGWETAHQKDSGILYYINRWSRVLQRERPMTPALPPGWDIATSNTTGCVYYLNADTSQVSASFDQVLRSLSDGCQNTEEAPGAEASIAAEAMTVAQAPAKGNTLSFNASWILHHLCADLQILYSILDLSLIHI